MAPPWPSSDHLRAASVQTTHAPRTLVSNSYSKASSNWEVASQVMKGLIAALGDTTPAAGRRASPRLQPSPLTCFGSGMSAAMSGRPRRPQP